MANFIIVIIAFIGSVQLALGNSNRIFQLGHASSVHRPWGQQNALQRPHSVRGHHEQEHEALRSKPPSFYPRASFGHNPVEDPALQSPRGEVEADSDSDSIYDSVLSHSSDYKVRILSETTTAPSTSAPLPSFTTVPIVIKTTTTAVPVQKYVRAEEPSGDDLGEILQELESVIPKLSKMHYKLKQVVNTRKYVPQTSAALSEESVIPIPSPTTTTSTTTMPPILAQPNNRTAIDALVKRSYPAQQLSYVVGLIRLLPERSQAFAYERLAEYIIAHDELGYAEQDLLKLTCELKTRRLLHILQQYDLYNSYVYPMFFGSKEEISLVAKTVGKGNQSLYFDYNSMAFGIAKTAEGSTRSRLNSWIFVPVPDACYFLLQQTSAEYIVGMVSEVNDETSYSRRVYLTVDLKDVEEKSARFHWKVSLFKTDEGGKPIILLENRETGLAIQWEENGSVFPNSPAFSTNQMWYQGQRD